MTDRDFEIVIPPHPPALIGEEVSSGCVPYQSYYQCYHKEYEPSPDSDDPKLATVLRTPATGCLFPWPACPSRFVEAVDVTCLTDLSCEVSNWLSSYCSSLVWKYECTDRTDYVTDDAREMELANVQWKGKTTIEGLTNSSNVHAQRMANTTIRRAHQAEADYDETVAAEAQLDQTTAMLASSIEANNTCSCSHLCTVKVYGICAIRSLGYTSCRLTCAARRAALILSRRVLSISKYLLRLAAAAVKQSFRVAKGAVSATHLHALCILSRTLSLPRSLPSLSAPAAPMSLAILSWRSLPCGVL